MAFGPDPAFAAHLESIKDSPNFHVWREALVSQFRSSSAGLSDETAEADTRADALAETVSATDYVTRFVAENGLDIRDPFVLAKSHTTSSNIGKHLLREVGVLDISGSEEVFSAWVDAFNKSNVSPLFKTFTPVDQLAGNLGLRALDEPRVTKALSGGLTFTGNVHDASVSSLLNASSSELLVSQFLITDDLLLGRIYSAGHRVNTVGGNFQGHVYGGMNALPQDILGLLKGFSASPKDRTDHFKMYGANLNSSNLRERQFLIGSINATRAAHGTNVESSFLLNWQYAQKAGMSEDVFQRLTDQGRESLLWAAHGDLENPAFKTFDKSGFDLTKSQVLTGQGIRAAHKGLMGELTAARSGRISIVTYNIGDEILKGNGGSVLEALRAGVEVNLIIGSRYNFNKTGEILMNKDHAFYSELQAFQQEVERLGLGAKFNVSYDYENLIHAKVSTFEFAGGRTVSVFGSANLDNAQMSSPNYRNAGMMLQSTDDSNVVGHADMMRRLAFSSAMFNPFRAGFASSFDQGSDTVSQLAALRAKYGLRPWELAAVTPRGMDKGFYRASIGGRFTVFGENIHLGSLTELNFFKHENEFGDRLFTPELSKAVTSTYGVRVGTKAQLAGSKGPSLVDPLEVVAAGVSTVNQMLQEELEQRALVLGSSLKLRQQLQNPYELAKLRGQVKRAVRDMYKNYAGVEPGKAAFSSKAHTRLLMPMDSSGRLTTRYGQNMFLDANSINLIAQGKPFMQEVDADINYVDYFADLSGLRDYGFSSGQLSRYSKSGDFNPARIYDFKMFETMRMTARKEQEDGTFAYFFLLPVSKMTQFPQRMQTNMAARNLTPLKNRNTMAHESFILNQDGSRLSGIKVRGMMVVGMTGDNAFANAEAWADQYFEASQNRSIKVDLNTVHAREDVGYLVKQTIDQLIAEGKAKMLEDGRALIHQEGLEAIGHRIAVAQKNINGVISNQYLDLKSEGKGAHGVIIDVNNMRAVRKGMRVTLNLDVSTVTKGHSGSRMILGLKVPLAFIKKESNILKEVDSIVSNAKVDSNILKLFGNQKGAILTGQGPIKDASLFLETGSEVIKQGLFEDYVKDLGAGWAAEGTAQLDAYRSLLGRMNGLFSEDEMNYLTDLFAQGPNDANKLLNELKKGRAAFNTLNGISLGNNPRHTALALTAFGLHAMFYINKTSKGFAESTVFNQMDGGPTAQMGMAAIPFIVTSALSASAVSMSNRPVVRFLNYHNGPEMKGIYNLMRLSNTNKQKQRAYKELFSSSILNTMAVKSETVAGHLEFSPLAYFQEGYGDDFVEMEKVVRDLRKATTVEEIAPLEAKLNELIRKVETGRQGETFVETKDSLVNELLDAQSRAGIKQSRLLVPIVESLSSGVNIARGGGNFISTMLLSADTMMVFGTFDDYSHEIQVLQSAIEMDRAVLRKVKKGADGKYHANFTADEEKRYVRLLQNVAKLELAHAEAPVTDLQKYFGGMLTQPGQNMIAGRLGDESMSNIMVLGEEGMERIKGAVRQQVKRSIRTLYDQKRIGTESGIARLKSAFGSLSHNTLLALSSINQEGSDINAILDKVANEVADNPFLRSRYAPGLFQRAGAPMGPYGIQTYAVYSVEEYTNLNGNANALPSVEDSRRAVFVHDAGMMFNLGDFDGDTASVGVLEHYIHLRSLYDLVGAKGMTAKELRQFKVARSQVETSTKSRAIKFAADYTGMQSLFGSANIERLVAKEMGHSERSIPTGDLEGMLYELEKKANEQKIVFGDVNTKNFDSVAHLIDPTDIAAAKAYVTVRDRLFNLAVASNKFSHDIYETYYSVLEAVSSGQSYQDLYRRSGADFAANLMKKAQLSFTEMGGYLGGAGSFKELANDQMITDKELLPFFIQTTYASTLVIGKTFEMTFMSNLVANRRHAEGILERLGKPFETDEEGKYVSIDELHFASGNMRRSKLSAMDLILQQMARDAIKPKKSKDAVKEIKERLARMAGMSQKEMIEAAMVDSVAIARDNEVFRGIEALYLMVYDTALDPSSSLARFGNVGGSQWGRSSSAIELRQDLGIAGTAAVSPEVFDASEPAARPARKSSWLARLFGLTPPPAPTPPVPLHPAVQGLPMPAEVAPLSEPPITATTLQEADKKLFALAGLDADMNIIQIGGEGSIYQYKRATNAQDARKQAHSRAFYEYLTAIESYTLDNIKKAASVAGDEMVALPSEIFDAATIKLFEEAQALNDKAAKNRKIAMLMMAARNDLRKSVRDSFEHYVEVAHDTRAVQGYIQASKQGGAGFGLISSGTDLKHKLMALEHQASRGKFSDSEVLRDMTMDVFRDFEAYGLEGHPLRAELEKTGNVAFAEMLYDLHASYLKKKDTATASIQRMLGRTQNALLTAQAAVEAAPEEKATREALEKRKQEHETNQRVVDVLFGAEKRLAAMSNIDITSSSVSSTESRAQAAQDQVLTSQAIQRGVSRATTGSLGNNTLQSGLTAALMGGVTGGMETFAINMLGAAVSHNPGASYQMIKPGLEGGEAYALAGSVAGGAVGGLGAGMLGSYLFRNKGPAAAGAANIIGGVIGGILGGAIGASLARKQSKMFASIDEMPDVSLEQEFAVGYDEVMEGFDRVRSEVVELYDESGDMVAQGFYTVSVAAIQAASMTDGDIAISTLDGYIANHTYEENSEAYGSFDSRQDSMSLSNMMYSDMQTGA